MSLSAPSFQISHFLPVPSETDPCVWIYGTSPFTEWLSTQPKHHTLRIVARDLNDTEACELLEHARLAVEQEYTVCIFTGYGGTCAEAPCGCFGYDGGCQYHEYGGRYCEDITAACLCSKKYGTICDYHQYELCEGCGYCDGNVYGYAYETKKETPDTE